MTEQEDFQEKKDRLARMFYQQHRFQTKYLNNEAYLYNIPFLKEMILAAHCELSEALQEIPWKSWKVKQEWDPKRLQEELVDVMHFTINLCLASGMDEDELYLKFIEKGAENRLRQRDNY